MWTATFHVKVSSFVDPTTQPRVFAALEQGHAPSAFSPNIQHLGKQKHTSLKSCTNQYFYINNGSKDNITGVAQREPTDNYCSTLRLPLALLSVLASLKLIVLVFTSSKFVETCLGHSHQLFFPMARDRRRETSNSPLPWSIGHRSSPQSTTDRRSATFFSSVEIGYLQFT